MNKSINSLYRKYRPTDFDGIVGQTHVVKTLQNQIKSGSINHAYLFVGTRGTGKTSIAKIMASKLSSPFDTFEIDAASNNSVDNVRELVEKTKFPPISAQYKVYIIDEVHMFSGSAFNALLKTLEEPPSHVVFILCTTEAHKLPQTILSRVLRFDFLPIADADLRGHVESIFKKEGIKATAGALDLIVREARGSSRDSLSIAESVSALTRDIKESDVELVLGVVGNDMLDCLLDAMLAKDVDKVTTMLARMFAKSVNAKSLVTQTLATIKARFVTTKSANLMKMYRDFAEIEILIKTATDPRLMFEGACYLQLT